MASTSTAAVISPSEINADGGEDEEYVFDVLFTGTGQSSSVPLIKHALHGTCKVCEDALNRPGSKNK